MNTKYRRRLGKVMGSEVFFVSIVVPASDSFEEKHDFEWR